MDKTNCEWCIPDNEVCGTCERYFAVDEKDRCAANPDDASCVAWKPFGFCPKCGRDLRSAQEEKPSSALTLEEFLNLSPEDAQKVYIHYLEAPEDMLPLCKNYGKVWEARWKGGGNDGCKD